ncbi:MAG: HD domain-containing protein [Christensenellaceae bacterium]|jgi:dGTPase|nr:HD domain-containing protein [Christensenellaceae bacterium]
MIKIHEGIEGLLSPYASRDKDCVRRRSGNKEVVRSQYAVDTDRILHCKCFNRYSDKTQVFSFYRNDDITRRSSHVQFVSRIARTIGKALMLNSELIEAIALGHDIGHTPFGHKGETFLNELYFAHTNRYFNHNVHSVRALQIENTNLTLQTLDGILCHCGEKAFQKYEPSNLKSFNELDAAIQECYTIEGRVHELRPSTLEGCVVRISDMIAYAVKDRQDAAKAKINAKFKIDISNPEFITKITEDIITNSMDKPYISMSEETHQLIKNIVAENTQQIYEDKSVIELYHSAIRPMMGILYEKFLDDLAKVNYESPIHKHYLKSPTSGSFYRHPTTRHIMEKHDHNDIVTDFIASMTDDYFIDVFKFLFPKHELNKLIKYVEYFDDRYLH